MDPGTPRGSLVNEPSPYVWVLNPEAELEMTHPGGFTSSKRAREQMAERRGLYVPLVQGERAYFIHELPRRSPGGPPNALPWCSTPGCLRAARRAGYAVPTAPSREVLTRTLSRRFLVESDLPAPPGRFFLDSGEGLALLQRRVAAGERLRVKRAYGCAGRGHWTLDGPLKPDDEKFLSATLRAGGALVEPELAIERELSMHGLVASGAVILGEPCELHVDAFGAPLSVERWSEPEPELARELRALTERAAELLDGAGYRGPFGLDFLRAQDEGGDTRTYASDWNSRFTLGWSTGLGARRGEALARLFEPE